MGCDACFYFLLHPDEKGQLAPGLLDYLADGILPLLHTYYSNFFHPYDMKEDQEEKEFTVSAMIAKSLVVKDM